MLNDFYKQFKSGTDIRGVASEGVEGQPVNLTDEVVRNMAGGFARFLGNKLSKRITDLKVAVGRDSRISGPRIAEIVIRTLSDYGIEVLDCGLATTPSMFMTTVELGCDGYIIKDCDVSILKKAIYTIYDGDRYIQPELQEQLEKSIELKTNITDKLNELTRREIEVLKLLAEGMFNKEIAVRLHISERTVKNHVSNLFKKIKVNDRTQAAVFAIKNSLI